MSAKHTVWSLIFAIVILAALWFMPAQAQGWQGDSETGGFTKCRDCAILYANVPAGLLAARFCLPTKVGVHPRKLRAASLCRDGWTPTFVVQAGA